MKNISFGVTVLSLIIALGSTGCATTASMNARAPASDTEASDSFSSILVAGGGIGLVAAGAMSCGMAYRTLTAEAEEIKNAQIYKQLDELIDARLKQGNVAADGEFAELLAARQELAAAVRRGDLSIDDLKQLGKRVESCFVR